MILRKDEICLDRKKRLGFIIPSANTILEPEIYSSLPNGVTAHFNRAFLKQDNAEELMAMREQLIGCVEELMTAQVDLIAFGCTTGSLIGGLNYDDGLILDLLKAGAPKAITTSRAVVDALRALEIDCLSIAAPYEKWLTQKVLEYLEDNGFRVARTRSLGIMDYRQADISYEEIYRLGIQADYPSATALFLSCTNLPTKQVLLPLQKALGKPVISSNSATLWRCLTLVGKCQQNPAEFSQTWSVESI